MRFLCLPFLLLSLAVCGCASRAESAGPLPATNDDITALRTRQQQLDEQVNARLETIQVNMDNSLGRVFEELELARQNAAAAWEKASAALELAGERQSSENREASAELEAAVQAMLTRLDRIEVQLKIIESSNAEAPATGKTEALPAVDTTTAPPVAPAIPAADTKKALPVAPAMQAAATKKTTPAIADAPNTGQAKQLLPPDLAAALEFAHQTTAGTVPGYGAGDWGLGAFGRKVLDRFDATSTGKRPDLITIIGFGNPAGAGDREKNDDLAWKRADAVKRYLTGRGIPENTLLTVNGGPATPPAAARVEVIAWQWESR